MAPFSTERESNEPRAIRVLVVDDSAFARKVVREVLEGDPRFEVVGIARDGVDALERVAELEPDVVTLDLVMPNLDGVGFLQALSKLTLAKLPRVVVVSMSEESSDLAVSALQSGAVALVHKPTALATDDYSSCPTSSATSSRWPPMPHRRVAGSLDRSPSAPPSPTAAAKGYRIVVLGTSTGGPQALTALLPQIPAAFPIPIAIALHIPVGYTEALARRLNDASAIEVVEAYEGVELIPRQGCHRARGMHLKIRDGQPPRGRLDLLPLDKPHRPSVDVLFEAATAAFGGACIGVVLTGMGDDGLLGSRAMRGAGGLVLTESESSCIVYGMPRSVKEAGLSSGEAPLDRMIEEIQRRL